MNPTPKHLKSNGRCYEVAANAMLMPGPQPLSDKAVLVHGRPTLQRPPYCEYGHAWVEIGERVIDKTNGFDGPRFLYYTLGRIDWMDCMYYTVEEARLFIITFAHFGPWEGPDAPRKTADKLAALRASGAIGVERSREASPPDLPFHKLGDKQPAKPKPRAGSKRTRRRRKRRAEKITPEDVKDFT